VSEPDLLRSPEAGGKVIRGSALRAAGYGAAFVIGGVTSVLLLRHLGVVRFGRYMTVMSLLAIVGGVTDAGLTVVGSRELAVRRPEERPDLLANLLAIRLLVTVAGVILAIGFALAAGYDSTLVYGTALGGIGVVLISYQGAMTLPLSVDLRMGVITALEVGKQVLTLIGVAALVAVGAELLPFLALQAGVGVAIVAVMALLARFGVRMRPTLHGPTSRKLMREALPVAVALAMNVVYVRVLVILMSLLATATEIGYFGTSFRIFEVLFVIPGLVLGTALPVMAVAGEDDRARLRFGIQSMTQAGLGLGIAIVMFAVLAAEPMLAILGGEEYRPAAPILRIQAVALLFVFLGQTWQMGLLVLRRQRYMVNANALALVLVIVLGLVLIPPHGAYGAAIAAVAAEVVLAFAILFFLRRADPNVVPSLGFVWRTAAAAAPAVALGLIPGLPDLVIATVATAVYIVLAVVIGAVPRAIFSALLRRDG
jgi:O-antigen/teichoic acid export membrane protein